MRRPRLTGRLVPLLTLLVACNSTKDAPGGPSGSGSGGTDGQAEGTGGSSNPGTGGTMDGMGGSSSGAAGAGAAAGTGGSGQHEPRRSAGCGENPPTPGEQQVEVAGLTGLFIVSLPPGYDPHVAYPLGFGFHGRNRNHENCQAGDCAGFQSVMGDHAVLVYLQSLRTPTDSAEGGWEGAAERENNVTFFEAVLESTLAHYCIDEDRVFAAGTSSGAHFVNVLGCRFGDRLAAVAPVAGYLPESTGCLGAPAALVIHGIDDGLETGATARDFYAARNGCSSLTEPPLTDVHQEIRDKRDAMPSVEDHGCARYQGCSAPVHWCEHSFGGYDGSTHGWPPTGGQLIWDFVQGLRVSGE